MQWPVRFTRIDIHNINWGNILNGTCGLSHLLKWPLLGSLITAESLLCRLQLYQWRISDTLHDLVMQIYAMIKSNIKCCSFQKIPFVYIPIFISHRPCILLLYELRIQNIFAETN